MSQDEYFVFVKNGKSIEAEAELTSADLEFIHKIQEGDMKKAKRILMNIEKEIKPLVYDVDGEMAEYKAQTERQALGCIIDRLFHPPLKSSKSPKYVPSKR